MIFKAHLPMRLKTRGTRKKGGTKLNRLELKRVKNAKLFVLCEIETLVEPVNTSAGINKLLLSGEERMAV